MKIFSRGKLYKEKKDFDGADVQTSFSLRKAIEKYKKLAVKVEPFKIHVCYTI